MQQRGTSPCIIQKGKTRRNEEAQAEEQRKWRNEKKEKRKSGTPLELFSSFLSLFSFLVLARVQFLSCDRFGTTTTISYER